mmetsp:Transcript_49719/g.50107  ORF Transcript_49719/g.50107 Transcript_49719/m.50107 type:complete len:389 (-) Transcript_49719:416-1582(-)
MATQDYIPLTHEQKMKVLVKAKSAMLGVSAKSTMFDVVADEDIPRLDDKELTLGRVLGRGGFCVVNEIKGIELAGDITEANPSTSERLQDRSYLEKHCTRDGDNRYAIKKISDVCKSDVDRFFKGTVDLAIEARYLAVIEHPNIIKMRAVAQTSPYIEGFYVVLDRLYDTLEGRMFKWKKQLKGVKGLFTKIKKKRGGEDPVVKRMLVAYDICSALAYLHSFRIIYRDLKPENIGFDVRDDVKIFDFGLAKELRPDMEQEDGLYKLTGYTGSLRYMAPEVAKCQPYNLTADSYSYGIMLWQLLAIESPYANYSVKMHADLVVQKSYRPAVQKSWPLSWGILLRRCWSASINDRPALEDIQSSLRGEIAILRGDEDAVLDVSRRTANSA